MQNKRRHQFQSIGAASYAISSIKFLSKQPTCNSNFFISRLTDFVILMAVGIVSYINNPG